MTAAGWIISISSLLAIGLAYFIGEAWGQVRGHARGYAAGQRAGRRAVYQRQRDVLRKQTRAAEETVEYLYERARRRIDDLS